MRDIARGIIGRRHIGGIALVLVLGWAWVWLFDRPAHAETIGYRIEVRACRGADCKLLPVSKRRWNGQYICQGRASLIERLGEAPRGRTLSARCVAVDGMAGA